METNEKIIKNPYGFIYITTNMVNGKRYLGQKRFVKNWQTYLGSGRAFQEALKKYGRESFSRNIVCFCNSAEELNNTEYELSVFLDVVNSEDWYNLVYGGGTMSGYVASEETRKKMSESRQGDRNGFYGKGEPVVQLTMDGEFIAEYVSASEAGRLNGFWEGAIRCSCNNRLGHPYGYLWLYKKDYDPNVKYTPKNILLKSVVQLTKDGVFVSEYESIAEASRATGIWAQSISNCCNGDMASTGGYMWIYKNEYDPSAKYKWVNHTITAVVQLTLQGEFIAQYNSIKEASVATGIHSSGIGHCCCGRHKTAGGFCWMHLKDYEKLTQQNDLKGEN